MLLAGCLGGGDAPTFREGFEAGLGEGAAGAAVGPEVDVADFAWSVDVSDREAAAGERSIRIVNEGTYDDGTTWAAHRIPVKAGRAYAASVTARFWSESESFTTIRDAVM